MNKQHFDILIENEVKHPELTKQQIKLLNERIDGIWEYKDGLVNVNGSIWLTNYNFTKIPVKFGKVSDYFGCHSNELTTLRGCPSEVGGDFDCHSNKLVNLDYAPTKIGGKFDCEDNPFQLNDKLFEYLARIDKNKINEYNALMQELKNQIPIQFGITDKNVIKQIWQSYMNILEGKNNG